MSRPLPWTGVADAIGAARFGEVRDALAREGVADLDRDAFILNGTAGGLLKDLVPEGGPAEAVHAWAALLHMLYLCWARDWPVAAPPAERLRGPLAAPGPAPARAGPPAVCYVQLPERLAWAQGDPGGPHEPLDGVFLAAEPDRVRALAVLGLHPARDGFTTVEADLPLPADPPAARPDGSAPFAPVLAGGARAGLVSVVSGHELAALALLALDAAER